MIRKPSADWQRRDESAAVRTVRTAAAVAKGSATVARRGMHAVRGLVGYVFGNLGLRRNRQRTYRKSKHHRHRGDGGLNVLARQPVLREGARVVGLTGWG